MLKKKRKKSAMIRHSTDYKPHWILSLFAAICVCVGMPALCCTPCLCVTMFAGFCLLSACMMVGVFVGPARVMRVSFGPRAGTYRGRGM